MSWLSDMMGGGGNPYMGPAMQGATADFINERLANRQKKADEIRTAQQARDQWLWQQDKTREYAKSDLAPGGITDLQNQAAVKNQLAELNAKEEWLRGQMNDPHSSAAQQAAAAKAADDLKFQRDVILKGLGVTLGKNTSLAYPGLMNSITTPGSPAEPGMVASPTTGGSDLTRRAQRVVHGRRNQAATDNPNASPTTTAAKGKATPAASALGFDYLAPSDNPVMVKDFKTLDSIPTAKKQYNDLRDRGLTHDQAMNRVKLDSTLPEAVDTARTAGSKARAAAEKKAKR
jgi:hypothetical protein